MAGFLGQPFNTFWKRIVQFTDSDNEGVATNPKILSDGEGNFSSLSLSDDTCIIQPRNDNTDTTLAVQNAAGNGILKVDTTNSQVKVGATLTPANTQYAYFGCNSGDPTNAGMVADTHYAIPFTIAGFGGTIANFAMGSSTSSSFNDTNPATSLTISATAMDIVTTYWYVMDNITIDAVKWLHGADAATGDSTAAHLMAYTVDTANGSTGGDLSNGVVVADSSTITNAGYEQVYYNQMTVQSADVDAGKIILFTFAADTVNSDFSINATVKYHIR